MAATQRCQYLQMVLVALVVMAANRLPISAYAQYPNFPPTFTPPSSPYAQYYPPLPPPPLPSNPEYLPPSSAYSPPSTYSPPPSTYSPPSAYSPPSSTYSPPSDAYTPPSPNSGSPPTPSNASDEFADNGQCGGFRKYAEHNLTCLSPYLRDYDRAVNHRQQFDLEAPGVILQDLLASDGTVFPGGAITWSYDIQSFPYLGKLGVSQSLWRLAPCTANLPHIHPRGVEIVTVILGRINLTVVEENGGRTATVRMSGVEGIDTFAVEQGLPHAEHNLECQDALFLSTFNSADAGVVGLAPAVSKFPSVTVATAFGMPANEVESFVARVKAVPGAAQGDAACLKRCGIKPVAR